MNNSFLQIIPNRLCRLAILIMFFSSGNTYATNSNPIVKNETDSLKALVLNCPSDTGKFAILSNFFWKYATSDLERVKRIGEWAYEVIKKSDNLRVLSDGYDIKGYLLKNDGKLDSAYIFYNNALKVSDKIGYKYRLAWSLYHLAELSNSLGNPAKGIEYMKSSVKLFNKLKTSYNRVLSLRFIAYAYQSMGMYDSAACYYYKKLEVAKKQSEKLSEISTYLQLAELYKKQYNNQKVVQNLNLAINSADSYNDEELSGIVYSTIGDFFSSQKKNFEIALDYYKKALEKCEKSKNRYLEAGIYNSMGNLYLEQGYDSMALAYNLKSFAIAKELDHRHLKSDAYKNLGMIYKKLGKYHLALENFNKCLETGCQVCPKITFHEALIKSGDLNFSLNNKKEALACYVQALEMAEKYNAKAEIAISKLKMGNYYCQDDQLLLAEKYYLSSMIFAKEANDIKLIKDCADTLGNFFLQQNKYKESFNYLHIARNMSDSIYKMDSRANIGDLQLKFEFEKAQKEKDEREILAIQEIKQQKIYRNSFLIISGLLALLGMVVFINYRRKKKDNKLLIAKNIEIERISKRLHESDQAKLRFFTNISHELRTPLTLIVSPLTKLLKRNKNEDDQRLYSLMQSNSRKLQDMINQLLDISKIDKNDLVLNIGLHDFNKQVRIVAAMFQSIADEKKIDFIITAMPENLVFCYDAERMEQIIINLLSNAFKFTPQNGIVEINIAKENDNAIIKIRDNGIGIPPESLEKVFERFYQTKATINRHFEGSGIGLALVKELVELHHGSISVTSGLSQIETGESREEKWTEFTVTLPIVHNENFTTVEEYNSTNLVKEIKTFDLKTGKNERNKNKETVLLVEDNNDLRTYLCESLSAEYNILESTNGSEAIEIAKKKIPDIIISDVMMPESDGYQLTLKVRQHIETSHIPVILLTAKAGRDSKIEGLESGADDYINKPFDEEELLLKVKNILLNRNKLQEKYKKQISPNPSETKEYSMNEQFILKLVVIIEKDLSNTALDVDYLSSNIGLSRQQLYRKLKAITGLSPVEFIRSIRIKRAAQLIRQNAASVSEIAFMTGFESLSYFTKQFKKEFGQLPSEYRKVKH